MSYNVFEEYRAARELAEDEWVAAAETRGHRFKLGPDGRPDFNAFDVEPHNGPQCVRCGEVFCWRCTDGDEVTRCEFADQGELPI